MLETKKAILFRIAFLILYMQISSNSLKNKN